MNLLRHAFITSPICFCANTIATGQSKTARYLPQFTPATIPAGNASTPVSMVLQTATVSGSVTRSPFAPAASQRARRVRAAVAAHPGLQAFRKRLRLTTSTRAAVLLATLVIGAVAALGGCTGTTSAPGISYPLVVTATSGTLHASFNMTLIVNNSRTRARPAATRPRVNDGTGSASCALSLLRRQEFRSIAFVRAAPSYLDRIGNGPAACGTDAR